MFESIVNQIAQFSVTIIYLIAILFSFVENIFPPSPSDLIVILGAIAVSHLNHGYFHQAHFVYYLTLSSIASSLGFMLMFWVGKQFGDRIIRMGRFKFISKEHMVEADAYFHKYGYKVIILNRFLPGTRSAVSFFAGVGNLNFWKTFASATISAFGWNFLMIYVGFILGGNLKSIDKFLNTYGKIGLALTVVVFSVIGYLAYKKRHKFKKKDNLEDEN